MPSYNKFNCHVENLLAGALQIFGSPVSDTLKVMLVNSPAPVATNSVKAHLTEIAAGFGYPAGGYEIETVTGTRVGATATLTGSEVLVEAVGGSLGPFQYVALYDDTPVSPLDPLISYWDLGEPVTLADGESVKLRFNLANPGTIFTMS